MAAFPTAAEIAHKAAERPAKSRKKGGFLVPCWAHADRAPSLELYVTGPVQLCATLCHVVVELRNAINRSTEARSSPQKPSDPLLVCRRGGRAAWHS